MTVVETLLVVLVLLLAIATTAAAYLGVLGVAGAIRFVRCERCGHLGTVPGHEALTTCAFCRHERLFHPIHSVRVYGVHAPRH